MRAILYSPYLDTFGGGERYMATVAECLVNKGYQVFIAWDNPQIVLQLARRFNLNLKGVVTCPNIFKGVSLWQRFWFLKGYDLAFYLSDGSIPAPLAGRNVLHFQVPFRANPNIVLNTLKLLRYHAVVVNSKFTKSFIDKTYKVNSQVVYPPVDVDFFASSAPKEKLILSVGRFSTVFGGKKQEVLIKVFGQFWSKYSDFKLVLAGGGQDLELVKRLKDLAGKWPVRIVTDISVEKLRGLYQQALIYWHAAGFGEDLLHFPQRAEHFGIAVVEAMAAGCVPVAFGGGGLLEIIDHGQDGFLWKTEDELMNFTTKLVGNQTLLSKMAKAARIKAQQFSKENFVQNLMRLI